MKSQRECYEKLLQGKKLKASGSRSGDHACLNEEGVLVDEKGTRRYFNFFDFEYWEVCEEKEFEKIQELRTLSDLKSSEDWVAYDNREKINKLIKAVNKLMEDK